MINDEANGRRMRSGHKASGITLDTPVTWLKGVGPVRAEMLARMKILTARDLLFHIPRRYEDASTITAIVKADIGHDVTVLGKVLSTGILPTRAGLRVFQAVITDESGYLEVSWPGQAYLQRTIAKGDWLLCSGSVKFINGRRLQPREFVNLGSGDDVVKNGRVLAIYPAAEGIGVRWIRGLIERNLPALLSDVLDPMPAALLKEYKLPSLKDALRSVHTPESLNDAESGRSRLAWDELFCLTLLQRRANQLERHERVSGPMKNVRSLTSSLKENLPFTLTTAQKRAIREIVNDLGSTRRMHRLLQGDVGSGKTVVALFAALMAIENGHQVAFMVPTELLAEQHMRTLSKLLGHTSVRIEFLSGRTVASKRKDLNRVLASGEPMIVVGTHALFQEGVGFSRLGLAIIDEQHRFGVEQRRTIASMGTDTPADVLLMTATPIPRSLALSAYGDLDVSVLDERPAGRIPIITVHRTEGARAKVMSFLMEEIRNGRRGYIVYPLIEASEKIDLKNATSMYEDLSAGALRGARLGLLHGRLSTEEKDAIMRRFRDGDIDVLVSTTVIEVGIDVPEATVMIVEHPERFGLSQLHQLRGRVGRGKDQSYCILLGNVGSESGERLKVLVDTDDGFEVARRDLELRGMGDLFGVRQSGLPELKIADLATDEKLVELAKLAAEQTLESDPELRLKKHSGLKRKLEAEYARAIDLFRTA